MDYQKAYDRLTSRAKGRILQGYYESHHVLPKCMGGTDDADNLVDLTPEEHFVAHQLLVKIYPEVKGLVFALIAMCMDRDGVRLNNKMFGWMRKKVAEAHSEAKRGIARPKWITDLARQVNKGRPLTKRHRLKISEALKGRKHSAEHNAKVSAALTGRPGPRRGCKTSLETRAKQRAAALGRRHKPETLAKMRQLTESMTPEQRSARAYKAWETKRTKLSEIA